MQLMPNTAYHITKDVSIKQDKNRLLRADYNLELGQKYVDYLMAKPIVDGNLFYMMTAYNAGPETLPNGKKIPVTGMIRFFSLRQYPPRKPGYI